MGDARAGMRQVHAPLTGCLGTLLSVPQTERGAITVRQEDSTHRCSKAESKADEAGAEKVLAYIAARPKQRKKLQTSPPQTTRMITVSMQRTIHAQALQQALQTRRRAELTQRSLQPQTGDDAPQLQRTNATH
jgi:hypothetical protein